MTSVIDDFVSEARDVSLSAAVALTGVKLRSYGSELIGPCPVCGGKDRFSVNYAKGVWHCRGAGRGGHDALSLISYVSGHDLNVRTGFLAACAELLGRPVPDGGERETEEELNFRKQRMLDAAAAREAELAKQTAERNLFREREVAQARGIWEQASSIAGSLAETYLRMRVGAAKADLRLSHLLRFNAAQSYWHGVDDFGRPNCLHVGPAMIAPFLSSGQEVVGCHITWIDLANPPKFRPVLSADGESLPTKKMRGHKKGCLIPVSGTFDRARWVVGEGIETVLAVAFLEGFPEDTFYAAAGDLGNMAGPADPSSWFNHPVAVKANKAGRLYPVRVPGNVPAPDIAQDDAFQVGSHVHDLVLLADGDSERVMTVAAMARAINRLRRDGLQIEISWPPNGGDFADVLLKVSR